VRAPIVHHVARLLLLTRSARSRLADTVAQIREDLDRAGHLLDTRAARAGTSGGGLRETLRRGLRRGGSAQHMAPGMHASLCGVSKCRHVCACVCVLHNRAVAVLMDTMAQSRCGCADGYDGGGAAAPDDTSTPRAPRVSPLPPSASPLPPTSPSAPASVSAPANATPTTAAAAAAAAMGTPCMGWCGNVA
jgi:hypothetical protein